MERELVGLRGVIEQVGSKLDLYDRPGNDFVSGFASWQVMYFLGRRLDLRAAPRVINDVTGI